MRAHARLSAEADGRGGTRLSRLRAESPLLLRQTGATGGTVTVHLVGGAAGPLGGDDLRLDVAVGPGAALCLRTVAASIALPGRRGERSQYTVSVTVAAGGVLHWLPEPTVAAAACHHAALATVDLEQGASLVWRDELICGRHGEQPGDLTVSTRVRYAGRALLHQTLEIGPGADGWSGPGVLGGARATGSLLRVAPHEPPVAPRLLGPTAVWMPLAGPAALITATADTSQRLRDYLDAALPALADT
ncbi:urease accessory protein UreD [Spirilliplanes yamanashiensis]|uniref:Urease accessory protein UreD n=1 Tax=Spirilliplanes yamanashiensis TaxID=42233 RepID=A0A8J4DMU0_9ACTN|nr:urease accessory protein UreD [Spirilliplanes yamanashiensis]MDP9818335.1 urease accessory protein [Spirilliplanes yamanashiensis]GIJ06554.1 urease accessory protein UreD [Spirilliplanes yamanashiensis]